jgi:hypothetical protein
MVRNNGSQGDSLGPFKAELNRLYAAVRTPTYGELSTHADIIGKRLPKQTITDLLTKNGRPAWKTVEAFVLACERHYRRLRSQPGIWDGAFDLALWLDLYGQLTSAANGKEANSRWPLQVGVLPTRAHRFHQRADIPPVNLLAEDDPDAKSGCYLLQGLGGTGKTQLAADLARRLWDGGGVDLLVWVNAVSKSAIVAKYAQAGREAAGIDEPTEEASAERFLTWLGKDECRWLVVLDDLTAPGDLHGLWPPAARRGRTVVTTQRRDSALVAEGRRLIEVREFAAADALDYLLARFADQPELAEGAEELATALGYLPIVLAQVSAYMLDRGLTCAEYLARFARQRLEQVLPERDAFPDGQQAATPVVWALSVERANFLQPRGLAHPALEIASVLDANGIPAGVFETLVARDYLATSKGGGATVSVEDAKDALRCLYRLSLASLEQDHGQSIVRVHGLVQRATRDGMADGNLEVIVDTAADALLAAWPSTESNAEEALLFRINAAVVDSPYPGRLRRGSIHPLLIRTGQSLAESGDVTAAAEYFRRLRSSASPRLDQSHPDALRIRHHLAYCTGQREDADHAVEAAVEAAAVTEEFTRVLGPDDPDTLRAAVYLARWHGFSGAPDQALSELSKLIPRLARVLGPEDPATLTARNDAAHFRGRNGDAPGAVRAFTELLNDRLRLLGADHPHTLTTRNDRAFWKGKSGDTAGAVHDFLSMIDDFTRVLGPDHLRTLAVRGSAAWLRAATGPRDEAEAELVAVLADFERAHGRAHHFTEATRQRLETLRRQPDN